MHITPVIAQLRQYSPTFAQRVAGGMKLEAILESSHLNLPAAFVLMGGDDPGENRSETSTNQQIFDEFDVLVVVKVDDERGQSIADPMHDIRAELIRALVGWKPQPGYEHITYEGGELMRIDRARAVYRFTFRSEWWLGGGDTPETFEELELAGLPPLEAITFNVDAIDPMADPNLKKPGPDGRIETVLHVELDQG
jgi:hypothetical protein